MHFLWSILPLLAATTAVASDGVLRQRAWANYPFNESTACYGPSGTATAATRCKPTVSATPSPASYWMEDIRHQGISAFNPVKTYQVFRNVKDFGATGDGVTDDTASINQAISSGNRCAPGSCQSTTITPAVVYFPAGTYLINSSLIQYYYTQMIGNPNSLPVLKATPGFSGFGLIDGNQYQAGGSFAYSPVNVFYRQVRNMILDLTSIPANVTATGIHWPTSQATSLQNVIFKMSEASGTQHTGLFVESGSGGFMTDLVFYGGLQGALFANQQFTVRNITFNNVVTAINMAFDWGWTFRSIVINNCSAAVNLSSQSVGAVTFIDSSISNTPIGFNTSYDPTSQSPTHGSLILENVYLNNVPVAIQGPGENVYLVGGTTTVAAYGQGHAYTPNGPTNIQGPIPPFSKPGSLLRGGKFYERSKPQYAAIPASQFSSTRNGGAAGDGVTDDTAALQRVIVNAALTGKIVFFDAGTYKVTRTLFIPQNSKIVGEGYSVIMSSGAFFANVRAPRPVVRIGFPGESGTVEWSDMIISTQGGQAGAILIEWNLASRGTPSGMWDVHTRIGGFAGSNLQVSQCPTTPTITTPPAPINSNCIAAFMSMHITKFASNLYLENVWLWTADHDLDDANSTSITIYTGRGLYIESAAGTIWLVGTAVEHHSKYQYQLANTRNIFMGQIQTETAYYQPNPNATTPFPAVAALNDPTFLNRNLVTNSTGNSTGNSTSNSTGNSTSPNSADGWGLRVLNSQSVLVYGAGLYSFFDNNSTTCSNATIGETCQTAIFDLQGSLSDVDVYNLNTIGATSMIDRNGVSLASYADNVNLFPDTIALFRSD